MGLEELRDRLDVIDERMLMLLSERAQVVKDVARFKRDHNLPIHVPAREAAIISRLQTANPGPLSDEAIAQIYRIIIEEMRKFENQKLVCDSDA